jgi:hypothetical protein
MSDELRKNLPDSLRIHTSRIQITSLDHFTEQWKSAEKISLVKIDVQGFEEKILKGMKSVIRENPGIHIITEYCPDMLKLYGSSEEIFFQCLDELKLEAFACQKSSLVPACARVLSEVCREKGYTDIVLKPSAS